MKIQVIGVSLKMIYFGNLGSETVPVKTANDPCPNGWRVPTAEEFQSLALSGGYEWVILNGIAGCYVGNESQKLFLPAAGVRQYNNGLLDVNCKRRTVRADNEK